MKRVTQVHHISKDPEVTVVVFKGEHRVLSLIQWYTRKSISKGFIKALKVELALNESRAIELEEKE